MIWAEKMGKTITLQTVQEATDEKHIPSPDKAIG